MIKIIIFKTSIFLISLKKLLYLFQMDSFIKYQWSIVISKEKFSSRVKFDVCVYFPY